MRQLMLKRPMMAQMAAFAPTLTRRLYRARRGMCETGVRVSSVTARAALLLLLSTGLVAADDRPRVVVVNHALDYIATRLLGDAAEVVFPVPADVDPAFWRPSIAEISRVQSADLILLNGAGFATWVDRVSLPRARVVNTAAAMRDRFIVTETITHSHGDGGTHSHDGLASYTWLDPTQAMAQADAAAGAIIARNLAPADEITARLSALQADLAALDAAAAQELQALEGITMIATHPRYQYFARRYGLTIEALEWEAGAMPAPEDLAALDAMVARSGAQILIWEATPSPEADRAVRALGLQTATFPPLAQPADAPFRDSFAASIRAITEAADRAAGG